MTKPLKLRSFDGTNLTDEAAMSKDRRSHIGEMQHRHFATVATIIREYPGEPTTQRLMAEYFADRLDETNKAFSRVRFLAACVPN